MLKSPTREVLAAIHHVQKWCSLPDADISSSSLKMGISGYLFKLQFQQGT
jgi:hypothetical protein